MAYKNLVLSFTLLAAMLLACAGAPMHADELDNLSEAVTKAETEYSEAEKTEKSAQKKTEENASAQKRAKDAGDDKEYQRLKSDGVDLKSKLRDATNARLQAERALASKRSELRREASKVAEEQITANGDTNSRAKRAGDALELWNSSLKDLLPVPVLTSTKDMDDAQIKATRQDDKARLKDYETWAEGEKSTCETEQSRADSLVKNEAKFKGADAHDRLLKESKALKEKLDKRLDALKSSMETAQKRLRSLEK
jgi:phage protein D